MSIKVKKKATALSIGYYTLQKNPLLLIITANIMLFHADTLCTLYSLHFILALARTHALRFKNISHEHALASNTLRLRPAISAEHIICGPAAK